MPPVFADFFAGIGLVQEALSQEGWTNVWSNDNDPRKHVMYSARFGSEGYLLGDVRSVKGGALPDVDLAHASFPCVDLSLAGGRNGLRGEESGLVSQFLRVLREMADARRLPPLVTLENVTGWISSSRGADFHAVLRELTDMGYACDAIVLDAAHFVPQSRPRVFVFCHQGTHKLMHGPSEGLLASPLRPGRLGDAIRDWQDISWGLMELPLPPERTATLEGILEDLDPNHSAWWTQHRVDYLLAQMGLEHRSVVELSRTRDSYRALTVYRRMRHGRSTAEVRSDGIAGCLRTPRGGSSRQILILAGRGALRARFMTPREYARLQGVPDTYPITVPANQALWGFGDAVCVPAVAWLAKNALWPLLT